MRLKIKIFFLIIPILILIGGALFYFFSKTKKQEFKFVEVKRGEIKEEISETGILEKGQPINLAFEIGGKIEKIYVSENQEIKKGELLAKLDDRETKESIEKYEIALEVAKKSYEKLKLQLDQLKRGDQKNEILESGISIIKSPLEQMFITLNNLEKLLFEDDLEEKKPNVQYYSEYNVRFSNYPLEIKEEMKKIKEIYPKIFDLYQKLETKSFQEREELIHLSYDLFLKISEIAKKAKEPVHYLKEIVSELDLTHEKMNLVENHFAVFSQIENQFKDLSNTLFTLINKLRSLQDQIDLLNLDLKTQELLIKEKEKLISEAKINLNKHYLYSPVSGRVSKIYLKEGESVDLMGKNPVFQIFPESPFQIKADIYEKDIPKIKIGNLVEISFPAFEEETFWGKVVSINKTEKIKEGVVYYEVKIEPENLPKDVLPGMSCDVKILVNKKEDVLILPKEVLKKKEGKYFVEVLAEKQKIEKEIETGIFGEDFVEIISGLSEGEKVIIP